MRGSYTLYSTVQVGDREIFLDDTSTLVSGTKLTIHSRLKNIEEDVEVHKVIDQHRVVLKQPTALSYPSGSPVRLWGIGSAPPVIPARLRVTPNGDSDLLNVVAFLALMGAGKEILKKSPDYIRKKLERYMGLTGVGGNDWKWGLDHLNFMTVKAWAEKWNVAIPEDTDPGQDNTQWILSGNNTPSTLPNGIVGSSGNGVLSTTQSLYKTIRALRNFKKWNPTPSLN